MNTRGFFSRFFVFGLIAVLPIALARGSQVAGQDSPVTPKTERIYGCNEGLEHLLPGDYYACRAKYHFQRKHYGLMLGALEESAHWASKDSQYVLGLLYFNGDTPHVPANRPLALAWLALAAERKNPVYVQTYAAVRLQSSPAEIRSAGRLWKKMNLEYGDKVAGLRALHRFNREIRPLDDAGNFGGIVFLNGYTPTPESTFVVVRKLHMAADKDFEGLQGTVTVGGLTSVGSLTTPKTP
jgi:hypothetical protein